VIALLLDTHALIWLLHGDSRLSANARQAIDSVTELRSQLAISAISLIETAYLEEKARIPAGTLAAVLSLLDTPEPTLVEIPVGRQIVAALLGIPRDQVPDMPDRVIAATALHLSVPLVSRDRKIQTAR
jgi:PIN domain nuclease of toxin-antitoxin system